MLFSLSPMSAIRTTLTLLGIAGLVSSDLSHGQVVHGGVPDFQHIIRSLGERMSALSSETEAQTFFTSTLAPTLDLVTDAEKTKPVSAGAHTFPHVGGLLSTELAGWHLATDLREAADLGDLGRFTALQARVDRQRWLLDERHPSLRRAATLLSVLATADPFPGDGPSEAFQSYANYLDRRYPDLAGTDQSWVRIAEEQGHEGISRRLQEFWRNQPAEVGRQALVTRYFDSRLRPILTAYLGVHSVRAEAEAERHVFHHWMRLRDWVDDLRRRKGLMRLCGTWHWTIHNHQNHQDHKMTISFPAPAVLGSEQREGIHPAQIMIHGDSVYLRWEFHGGVQEDSLLFGKEGQRLEGSFVNSAGAWGSISGKRLTRCEDQTSPFAFEHAPREQHPSGQEGQSSERRENANPARP